MNKWWWLVLIIQVTSCKVLAQGESTTARGDCQEPDCKNGLPWTQEESPTDGQLLVKRQPLLSRWGSQRLSDLFYFDYKRRPAFSSWGGKRGPAFSSWGGKRSVRNTPTNQSHDWSQHSSSENPITTPYHTLETSEILQPINVDIEDRKLYSYSLPNKNPLIPFIPSSWVSRGESLFYSGEPGKESYLQYIPFKESNYSPQSDTKYEMDSLDEPGGLLSNFNEKRAAAFNSWGGKRAAAFNSWGGKRALSLEDSNEDKRAAAFNSWGGKRAADLNDLKGEKRAAAFNSWGGKRSAAFNSWGGKRVPELDDLDEDKRAAAFNSWGGKRTAAFSSWGGKRAQDLYDVDEDKRAAAFNSWGGKRAAAFNSWGGKRVSELNDLDEDKRTPAFNSWGGKRAAAFNSWGGKRAHDFFDLDEEKRAAAFNSWGGKRAAAFNSWGGKRAAAFNSWGGKRAAAFNSWGGKRAQDLFDLDEENRAAAFNSWGGKRAAAFNSWGGKRAAAFNSWGGKRAAAFNSWGGKRVPEVYDLGDDKRAAAFSSWGGKRVPAFNSWGGKRAAAFNSWGGKRTNTAFSSWGGKRASAAFNSWGGKRTPAFNSWGGKRSDLIIGGDSEGQQNLENNDEHSKYLSNFTENSDLGIDTMDQTTKLPQESSPLEQLISNYNDGIQKSNDRNYKNDDKDASSIREKRERLTIRAGKRKPRFYSWGGKKRSESDEIIEDDSLDRSSAEDYGYEPLESGQDEDEVENDNSISGRNIMDDKNFKKRIDELYTTHLRSGFSGKRKPAFSSWGGKRSESDGSDYEDNIENKSRKKRSSAEEDLSNEAWGEDSNDVIDNSLFPTNTVTCCVKKLQYGDRNLFMQMLFRTNGFRDLSWPSIRSNRRGADFYAWGGKRTSL